MLLLWKEGNCKAICIILVCFIRKMFGRIFSEILSQFSLKLVILGDIVLFYIYLFSNFLQWVYVFVKYKDES